MAVLLVAVRQADFVIELVTLLIVLALTLIVYLNHGWVMVACNGFYVVSWFSAIAMEIPLTIPNLAMLIVVVLTVNMSLRVETILNGTTH